MEALLEESRAFQNQVLLERFTMVVEFLDLKLGSEWTKANIDKPQDLLAALRSGEMLCKLVGVHKGASARECVDFFRRACLKLGLEEDVLFSEQDLMQTSSLACICVVNCLQELRLKLLEMDRALLNEHFSSPIAAKSSSRRKSIRNNSPLVAAAQISASGGLIRKGSTTSLLNGLRRMDSPSTPLSKGLLDLVPGNKRGAIPIPTPLCVEDPSASEPAEDIDALIASPAASSPLKLTPTSRSRRVSISTLNAQASIARVQERMASTYKDRCRQLEAGNKELLESVEELQETIASLQRSKQEYQLETEKLQDRNRLLLSNFRVMEVQIKACVDAWEDCKATSESGSGFAEHIEALKLTWQDIEEAQEVEAELGKTEAEDQELTDVEEEEDEAESEAESGERPSTSSSRRFSCAKVEPDNERASEELARVTEELERVAFELETAESRVVVLEKELESERKVRVVLQDSITEQLTALKYEFADLSNDARSMFTSSASSFSQWARNLQSRVAGQDAEKKILQQRFEKENTRRKQLLNTVHNLRGNIRVMCRVRPVLSADLEKEDGGSIAVEVPSDESVHVTTSTVSATGQERTSTAEYEFDCVFGPTSTQQHVFEEVLPLVESVMDGFSSCIFAYGQTGSGKTYTMSGDAAGSGSVKGINLLALEELFKITESRKSAGLEYTFKVRNVEIYCEKVVDLLSQRHGQISEAGCFTDDSDAPSKDFLDIHYNDRDGVSMPGCTEITVASAEEVEQVMRLGSTNRTSAHTKMNLESSRSHSVVMISVVGEHAESGRISRGQLVLVDLAGSERLAKSGVTGAQLKEAQAINKSLSCLGDVIAALEQKAAHVPFRNSKLTALLQDSLGKDNKALMILQVSPTTYNAQESTCSLNFAARVRNCELGKAKKKEAQGPSSKATAALRATQERAAAAEALAKKLSKDLEDAKAEAAEELDRAAKEAERQRAKVVEQAKLQERNDQSEIKALREKLANRAALQDPVKVPSLETELHQAKVEITNLRQQLRSTLSSANFSSVPVSSRSVSAKLIESLSPSSGPARRPLAPSNIESVLQQDRRKRSLDNVQPLTPEQVETNKKQVSWKNTPVLIPIDNSRTEDEVADADDTASLDEDALCDDAVTENSEPTLRKPVSRVVKVMRGGGGSASAAAGVPKPSRMGGASRVLQTPGKKKPSQTTSTARRIRANPVSKPAWQ